MGFEEEWDSKQKPESKAFQVEGMALAKAQRQERMRRFLRRVALFSDAIRANSWSTEKVS